MNFTVSFKLRDMIFVRSFLIDISLRSMRLLSNHEQRTLSCSTLSISYISQSNSRSSVESHQQKHFTTLNDGPKKLVSSSVCKLKPTSRFPVLKADCFLELNTFVLIGRCDLESSCNSVPLPKYSIILKKFGNYLSFYSVNLTKCKISLPSGSWQKSEKKNNLEY